MKLKALIYIQFWTQKIHFWYKVSVEYVDGNLIWTSLDENNPVVAEKTEVFDYQVIPETQEITLEQTFTGNNVDNSSPEQTITSNSFDSSVIAGTSFSESSTVELFTLLYLEGQEEPLRIQAIFDQGLSASEFTANKTSVITDLINGNTDTVLNTSISFLQGDSNYDPSVLNFSAEIDKLIQN